MRAETSLSRPTARELLTHGQRPATRAISKFMAVVFAVAWSSTLAGQPPPATRAEREDAARFAKEANESLMRAKDYASLTNLVESWKANLTETAKASLEDVLFLEDLQRKGALSIGGSVPQPPSGQDLSSVGGRAAWALEQLLGCQLSPVRSDSTPEDIAEVRQEVARRLRVVNEKLASRDKERWAEWVSTLGDSERLRLAKDPKTDEHALAQLAKDENVEIRRGAAANPSTSVQSLRTLLDDPDAAVRTSAMDNLKHARSLVPRSQ